MSNRFDQPPEFFDLGRDAGDAADDHACEMVYDWCDHCGARVLMERRSFICHNCRMIEQDMDPDDVIDLDAARERRP